MCMGGRWAALGLLLWLGANVPEFAHGGKVLVMPVDGSHWLSMKILVLELQQRGHDVVVLVPEANFLIKGTQEYRTKTFHVPYSSEQLENNLNTFKEGLFTEAPGIMDFMSNLNRLVSFTDMQVAGCKGLLYDTQIMGELQEEGFELLLTDPFLPCGSIVAEFLSIPAIYFLRGIPCGLENVGTQCPVPPSSVPRFFTGNSDVMNFLQRVKNVLQMGMEAYLCRKIFGSYDELVSQYLQRDATYGEILGHGAIWLLRYDFTFEYPKPLMPNMVLIGGVNCGKKKSLEPDLEKFVNSSKHGFVVFTLGSMVSRMPAEKAQVFFEAFRRIPQKVIWRYTGDVPDNIPKNVKLMKWLPQNDLLAHPKVKAFITHGGTHGIYEGICNGVPMVMLPLFGDQGDNVQRMVNRGVAETLSIYDITSDQLVEALNKVINDTSYKEKMTKLSAIHNDRPVEPLDLAVFWTEFVMRHKGAAHLRPAAHDLNWFQYHSLDVIGLLIAIVVTIIIVTFKSCAFCFRKCCRRNTPKKKKE